MFSISSPANLERVQGVIPFTTRACRQTDHLADHRPPIHDLDLSLQMYSLTCTDLSYGSSCF